MTTMFPKCFSVCALAAVLALLISGCSSGGGKQSAPTTTAESTTTVRSAQRPRDFGATGPQGGSGPTGPLEKPVADAYAVSHPRNRLGSMPTPHSVTQQFFFAGSNKGAWLDPATGVTPKVTAQTAWIRLTNDMRGGGHARLVFGYYTSVFPMTNGHPDNVRVLAWAVSVTHVTVSPFSGPRGPSGPIAIARTASPQSPQPVCVFGSISAALNATTGQPLPVASWGTD